MDPLEPVEVYTAFNPTEAEIIKNMLNAEGLDATVSGDAQGGFQGATPEVAVMVHSRDRERARELIRVLQANAANNAG